MLFRRVYPHLANWVPIPRVAAFPTFRHGLFCRFVDAAAALKNNVLLPIMALRGCHELDAAVAVLGVVPGHEAQPPLAGLFDRRKRLLWIGRCVFQCPEQRLGIGIVVTDGRATERRYD